jgi:hypothetical protein
MLDALNPICSSWKNFIWEKGFFWFLCYLPCVKKKPSNDRVYVDLLLGFLFDQCSSSDLGVMDDLGFGVTLSPAQKLFINNASVFLFALSIFMEVMWEMTSFDVCIRPKRRNWIVNRVFYMIMFSIRFGCLWWYGVWSHHVTCSKLCIRLTVFWIIFLHCQHLWRWCERWQFSMCEYVKREGTDL